MLAASQARKEGGGNGDREGRVLKDVCICGLLLTENNPPYESWWEAESSCYVREQTVGP